MFTLYVYVHVCKYKHAANTCIYMYVGACMCKHVKAVCRENNGRMVNEPTCVRLHTRESCVQAIGRQLFLWAYIMCTWHCGVCIYTT